ncbi:MAG: hypothetical protein AAFU67_10820, partial [Bacteroidota bacterium]
RQTTSEVTTLSYIDDTVLVGLASAITPSFGGRAPWGQSRCPAFLVGSLVAGALRALEHLGGGDH